MKSKRVRSNLVAQAKRKNFKKRHRVCEFEGCSSVYLRVYPRQKYCKKRCSVLAHQAQQEEWRKENIKKVRVWKKKWADSHRELRRKQGQQYYLRHRADRILSAVKYARLSRQKKRTELALAKKGRKLTTFVGLPFYKDCY